MQAYFDSKNHPKIKLIVGGSRQKQLLTAVLDTGFDGFLSLPISIAVGLGLELVSTIQVQYADGRVSNELVFSVTVEMDGESHKVSATLTDSVEALVGTALLSKNKVIFDFLHKKIQIL